MSGASDLLIVNADDFGQNEAINAGVARAHEAGIVTSASLMVRWPAAGPAAAYARAHPTMSVGIHLDLGEWRYSRGRWEPVYRVCDPDDDAAVVAEFAAQLARFRELLDRDPTHLDSHQHVHRDGPAARHASAMADQLGVPLRDRTPGIRYDGRFYGMSGRGQPMPELITVDALEAILASLPDGPVELGCHPGLEADADSPYRAERERELATLTDARARAAVERAGRRLGSFRDLRPA